MANLDHFTILYMKWTCMNINIHLDLLLLIKINNHSTLYFDLTNCLFSTSLLGPIISNNLLDSICGPIQSDLSLCRFDLLLDTDSVDFIRA